MHRHEWAQNINLHKRNANGAGKSLYQNAEAKSIAVRFVREWQGSWERNEELGHYANTGEREAAVYCGVPY